MTTYTCAELGVCKAASPACAGCTLRAAPAPAPITLDGPYYPKPNTLRRLARQLRRQLGGMWRYLTGPSAW